MSLKQLQDGIRSAPREEKLHLLALIKHELRTGTPSRQDELERAHADIDAGAYVTLKQLKR